MRLTDYVSIRCSINSSRQISTEHALSTAELGILSLLHTHQTLNISDLARIQHTSRPTMTHRVSRLVNLKLIDRRIHPLDNRSVQCSISDEGQRVLDNHLRAAIDQLPTRLFRSTMRIGLHEEVSEAHRFTFMHRFFEATAPFETSSGCLVMLVCFLMKDGVRINDLVERTSLLQPTISMTVKRLEKQGLLKRQATASQPLHTAHINLTSQGKRYICELVAAIHGLQLHSL